VGNVQRRRCSRRPSELAAAKRSGSARSSGVQHRHGPPAATRRSISAAKICNGRAAPSSSAASAAGCSGASAETRPHAAAAWRHQRQRAAAAAEQTLLPHVDCARAPWRAMRLTIRSLDEPWRARQRGAVHEAPEALRSARSRLRRASASPRHRRSFCSSPSQRARPVHGHASERCTLQRRWLAYFF
jgi:hypothetical protein